MRDRKMVGLLAMSRHCVGGGAIAFLTLFLLIVTTETLNVTDVLDQTGSTRGGFKIRIVGNGFGSTASPLLHASIGPTRCTKTRWLSATSVRCLGQMGVGKDLTVAVQLGTSPRAEMAHAFTFYEPVVRSMVPRHFDVSGGDMVTIFGSQFGFYDSHPVVKLGNTVCGASTWLSESKIECRIPKASSVGPVDIAVGIGNQWASRSGAFSYYDFGSSTPEDFNVTLARWNITVVDVARSCNATTAWVQTHLRELLDTSPVVAAAGSPTWTQAALNAARRFLLDASARSSHPAEAEDAPLVAVSEDTATGNEGISHDSDFGSSGTVSVDGEDTEIDAFDDEAEGGAEAPGGTPMSDGWDADVTDSLDEQESQLQPLDAAHGFGPAGYTKVRMTSLPAGVGLLAIGMFVAVGVFFGKPSWFSRNAVENDRRRRILVTLAEREAWGGHEGFVMYDAIPGQHVPTPEHPSLYTGDGTTW